MRLYGTSDADTARELRIVLESRIGRVCRWAGRVVMRWLEPAVNRRDQHGLAAVQGPGDRREQ